MKTVKALSLILSVLFLAGCASTKCKSKTSAVEPVAAAPVAEAVAAPVEPVVAPEAVAEPEEESVPVATRKYVSK